MPHYKDLNSLVHFIEHPEFEYFLPVGCTQITEEEALSLTPTIQPPVEKQFSSLDFLDRFTLPEQLSVVEATMVSPQVKLWYDRLLAADFINLEDPRTEAGVNALISAGLLTASRKAEILTP